MVSLDDSHHGRPRLSVRARFFRKPQWALNSQRNRLCTGSFTHTARYGVGAVVDPGPEVVARRPILGGAHKLTPLSWLLVAGCLPLLSPLLAWRERTLSGVAAASGLCVAVSLFISADPRYLVPALGVLALCAGLAADWAIRGMNRSRLTRLGQPRLAAAGYVLAAIPILWSSASYANAVRSTNGLPPTTPAAIRRFIATRVSCYGAVTFLNRIAGSKYRAWSPGCQTARYYAKGLLIGDVFSTGSANRVFDRAGIDVPNDETLWNRLAPLKVEWLIVPRAKLANPTVLEAHGLFTLATSVGTSDVFKVKASR